MQVRIRVEGMPVNFRPDPRFFEDPVPDGYTSRKQRPCAIHMHCAWHGCCSAVAQRPASRGAGLLEYLQPDRMTLLHGCGFLRALPADAVAAKESR